MNDATTAFLAFAAIFVGLAAYLARLGLHARSLEARLDELESHAEKGMKPPAQGGLEP